MSLGAMMAGGNPAANRGRSDNDFYPTPVNVTQALLNFLEPNPASTVLEPCAGDGAMVDVLRDYGCNVTASDIATQRLDIPIGDDIIKLDFRRGYEYE